MDNFQRVGVIKRELTTRDSKDINKTNFLTGVVSLSCTNLEYLHVGTGKLLLNIKSTDRLKEIVIRSRNYKEFYSKVSRHLNLVSYDYNSTLKLGSKYCIPGTTIKGSCRSRLELLTVNKHNKTPCCFIKSSVISKEPQRGQHGWRHFNLWKPATYEIRAPCDATKSSNVCITCDLFGTSGLASRVYFGNMYSKQVKVYSLTLDHNEKIEAIAPNSEFEGEISFYNLQPWELGLVLIGLGAKRDGSFTPILLGKSKYREREVVDCVENKSLIGKKITFGKVLFSIKGLSFKVNEKILELEEKLKLKVEGDELFHEILDKNEIQKLIKYFVEQAVNEMSKYCNFRVDFEEAKEIEKFRR